MAGRPRRATHSTVCLGRERELEASPRRVKILFSLLNKSIRMSIAEPQNHLRHRTMFVDARCNMARRQIMTFAYAAGLRISLTRVWNYGKDIQAVLDIAKCDVASQDTMLYTLKCLVAKKETRQWRSMSHATALRSVVPCGRPCPGFSSRTEARFGVLIIRKYRYV